MQARHVLVQPFTRLLLRFECIFNQVLDTLVLLALDLFILPLGLFALLVPHVLQLRLHLLIGEGLLALLHPPDVLEVLLLDPPKLLNDLRVTQVYVVFTRHLNQLSSRLPKVKVHDVIEVLLGENGLFEFLLDYLGLLAPPSLLEQTVALLGAVDHQLKVIHLGVVRALVLG